MTDNDTTATDAAADAAAAAVPGARGWFRFSTAAGAVNVRTAGALTAAQYDDGMFRVIALGVQTFELDLGPYEFGEQAEAVCDAALQLAYDDAAWPTTAAA